MEEKADKKNSSSLRYNKYGFPTTRLSEDEEEPQQIDWVQPHHIGNKTVEYSPGQDEKRRKKQKIPIVLTKTELNRAKYNREKYGSRSRSPSLDMA